jgi:hypothetical protein
MKELTAVEWLFLMLNNPNKDQEFANKLLQQAKEMEKEQRMSDFTMGITNANRMEATKDAEEYYNETYGGNK